jgi:tetratricopeptide (TPR) repeat protein
MLFQLIGVHYANGNFAAVEAAVRSLLATVPNDLASLQFLGLVYYRTGRTQEAIRIFDSTPIARESAQRFEMESGDDSVSRNDYSAAAACRIEATHRNADLAHAWYDLGLTLNHLGRPDRAVVAFRSALIARPAFPEATEALGSIAPCVDATKALGQESSPPGIASVVGGSLPEPAAQDRTLEGVRANADDDED